MEYQFDVGYALFYLSTLSEGKWNNNIGLRYIVRRQMTNSMDMKYM